MIYLFYVLFSITNHNNNTNNRNRVFIELDLRENDIVSNLVKL